MITYKAQAIRDPHTKVVKYYAQSAPSHPVTLADVARQIEKQSTVSSADIKAVLDALQGVVIDHLKNGQSVRLGDLGSFRTTIQSMGVDTAEKVKAAIIESVNVRFTSSTVMKREMQLQNLRFTRMDGAATDEPSDPDPEP